MLQAPDISMVLVLAIFLAILVVLRRNVFAPLSAILREREEESTSAGSRVARARAEFDEAVRRVENELSLARQEALKLREERRTEGRLLREEKTAQVKAEAGKRITSAAEEIGGHANRAAAELSSRTAALARELAEKILGRSLAA